jgi:hypothetical protein
VNSACWLRILGGKAFLWHRGGLVFWRDKMIGKWWGFEGAEKC